MLKLKKNLSVYTLLAGRVATNIADSLFYLAILWYFKQVTHSTMSVSIIFAITSGIDMLSFGFYRLSTAFRLKSCLKFRQSCRY